MSELIYEPVPIRFACLMFCIEGERVAECLSDIDHNLTIELGVCEGTVGLFNGAGEEDLVDRREEAHEDAIIGILVLRGRGAVLSG
jgi:hypothetical protein